MLDDAYTRKEDIIAKSKKAALYADCLGCPRATFYIALDYDTDLSSTSESSDKENAHKLSDGNIITAGAESFR